MLKEREVIVTAEGRDHGKTFLLVEMPSAQAEGWALRAFGAMARAGVDAPEEIIRSGMGGLSVMGLKALLAAPWVDLQPLMAEMMACVRVVEPGAPISQLTGKPISRPINDRGDDNDDIEEVATRVMLRDEVFELHTGFSIAAALFSAVAMATNPTASSSTPTPPDSSEA